MTIVSEKQIDKTTIDKISQEPNESYAKFMMTVENYIQNFDAYNLEDNEKILQEKQFSSKEKLIQSEELS